MLNNKKQSGRKPLLKGASLLAAAAAAMTAAPGVAQAQDGDDEIVVTGTRIQVPGFSSNSPIATITAEAIDQQIPVNIEEVLRNQPQFASGNGSQVNNGGSGASTLDLRGLSEPRTLALINGNRMVGFAPSGLFDANIIPLGLLERVDVVTGGASAVYGSDAVAGVVNFILNDDFQGFEVRANHSENDLHDSGDTDSIEITMGSSFDDGRGNAALSVGWLNREAVYQINGPAALAPGASSTTTPTAFDTDIPFSVDNARGQIDANGNIVGFYQGFDFNGQNLYQQPQERWQATAIASYEINPNVEAYSRFSFMSQTAAPQIASSGTFGFSFDVPLNNPFLTDQAEAYLRSREPVIACPADPTLECVNVGLRWRAVEVGPRQYRYEYDTFQTLVGFRGDLGDTGWTYDIAGAHGESSLKRQQNNDISSDAVQQALYATDASTCLDPSNGCVPINIFNPSVPADPAGFRFVALNLQVQALQTQDYITGSIAGDLGDIRSPWASSPIGLSFGAEYRNETMDYQPDAASQAGVSPGFGQTLPVNGSFDVMEFFTEALVPLVEDAPLANSISLELGARSSDYSTSGRVNSYKYGLEWSPVEDLRLRAMFQRAVRAANINELFGPYTPGTGDLLVDPCAGVTLGSNADLYNLCVATGVPNPAALSQPTSGQINNFSGGNPDLDPESADTITVGFVFRPSGIPGLSITADYYDIEIVDAISIRPAYDILDGCYNAARNPTFDPNFADCQAILRNPSNGTMEGDLIYGVDQRTQNIGSVHVEGIDYSIAYTFDLGSWGEIAAALDGTHLLSTAYTPSDGGEIDCVGFYGKTCGLPSTISASVGGPVSEDRFVQSATWSMGDWELGYRWRFLSEVEIDPLTRANGEISGELDPDSLSIDNFNYLDLSAAWQATEALRVQAAVTNITGEEAPFVYTTTGPTTFNSGNTYPSTYDVLGRVFSVGVTARF
ncbi:MAG: TonB-dependent receptor [Hyphomonadaceae bacterium]|nr:TonB-dependent receptor [Hyphomonadaceae bacterium]